jgi:hypothetical protein
MRLAALAEQLRDPERKTICLGDISAALAQCQEKDDAAGLLELRSAFLTGLLHDSPGLSPAEAIAKVDKNFYYAATCAGVVDDIEVPPSDNPIADFYTATTGYKPEGN